MDFENVHPLHPTLCFGLDSSTRMQIVSLSRTVSHTHTHTLGLWLRLATERGQLTLLTA